MIERLERELEQINIERCVKKYREGSPDYVRLLCRKSRIEGALAMYYGEEV